MNSVPRSALVLMLTGALLSACSSLPTSGPADRDVQRKAAVRVGDKERAVNIDYVLLDLTKAMLPYFKETSASSLRGFGGGRGGAPASVLGIGDIVQVTIFESSTGGLFIPSDAGSRPGNFITLPSQEVDRSGSINVPYAGRVRAAGRLAEDVQREIENALINRAIEPQVLVSVVENRSRQISVLGDVATPAKLPLNPSGERVLDVIARAGGLTTPGVETYITLQRRGREGTIRFSDLINTPAENIFVAAGDTIYINRERRTYLAFGASGLNGRLDFEESNLTVAEALGKAGGLLDARADPARLYLYRLVHRSRLRNLHIDLSRFHGDVIPVIIRANLRDPATFFALRELQMVDKDILYVGNADAVEFEKFVNIVATVTGGVAVPVGDAAGTRTAVRSLTN